jgi:PPE-repeat protein
MQMSAAMAISAPAIGMIESGTLFGKPPSSQNLPGTASAASAPYHTRKSPKAAVTAFHSRSNANTAPDGRMASRPCIAMCSRSRTLTE